MITPPQNTEIWTCPCMLYWTTMSAGLGHYPVQSKLFFVQLEGFLVSQSRIPVNLLVEWLYTNTLASDRNFSPSSNLNLGS